MIKEYVVEVKNLHKSFRLPTEKSSSLKQTFINRAKGIKGYQEQKVLKGISFNIEKGDFFGIVGRNGSGKSTLLKLLAGIYEPDKGEINVKGTIVPFIELGVGFNPELTGRENIYLNGALLGFSTKEVDAMYNDIVDFAELHEFMDQKLKNYSSGMQVRLAFSIAIKAQGDILILDEVLAVGDEAFQRKCFAYFAELKRKKKTVILVTHAMDSVQQFCNKAMLINDGRVDEFGGTSKVTQAYEVLNAENVKAEKTNKGDSIKNKNFSIKVRNEINEKILLFDITLLAKANINSPVITFVMNRNASDVVYRWSSDGVLKKGSNIKKNEIIKIHLEIENIFPDDRYDVQIAVKKSDRSEVFAIFNGACVFTLKNVDPWKRDSHWKPKEAAKIVVSMKDTHD